MRQNFWILFLLVACLLPCRAQVQKMPFTVAKEIISSASEAALVPSSARNAQGLAAKVSFWEEQVSALHIDMALGPYFLPNPQIVSEAQRQENQKMQFEMVRHWLEKEYAAFKHSASLSRCVRTHITAGEIDYLDFIPSQPRLLLLGEIHAIPWIKQEIFTLIKQIQAAYPDRPIYYASEFIYADGDNPGAVLQSESEVAHFSISMPFYREFNALLFDTGVRMVGLENPENGLKGKLNREGTHFWHSAQSWNVFSPQGVRERNRYWAEIIHGIYAKDPQALVVVHAGNGHTSYRQLNSLSRLLQPYKPFVVDFSYLKKTYAPSEKYLAISPQAAEQACRKQTEKPGEPIYFVQALDGKRAAWLMGSNLFVRRPRTQAEEISRK